MKNRTSEDLRNRTKQFALRIIHLYLLLPKTKDAQIIGNQLFGIVIQELDETAYWLELLFDAKIDSSSELKSLLSETDELIAIFTSISRKVKNK